jgi:WD40 repeat protein/uncharacterized protein YjbI with pentapeptide repeats/Cdc6-like AAA superfamily ATPase
MAINPFYLRVLPIEAPFCGRTTEGEELIAHAKANTNVVLYSPRRYGKTSLVKRVQHSLEEDGFITLYIDISDASTSDDIASLIARAIYSYARQKESLVRKVMGILQNWRPVFTPDPSADGNLSMTIQPVSQKSGIPLLEETLEAFDKLMTKNPQQINIVIDEFQEITSIRNGEKIEALLRKHIQHQSNCSWFFLGSRRRMLAEMFDQKDRPFFNSAIKLQLPPLREIEAEKFVMECFKDASKECSFDIAQQIVTIAHCYPYYVQRLSYAVFEVSSQEELTQSDLDAGFRKMVEEEAQYYSGLEKELAAGQKNLLKALATEQTNSPFAITYQKRHRLGSLSAIQNSLKKLETLDHIERDKEGLIHLTDPIFALWITGKEHDRMPESQLPLKQQRQLPFGQSLKELNVEEAMKGGYADEHGYLSSEAVEIRATLPEPEGPHNRIQVKIFLSYAHDDKELKERFFSMIRSRLKTSKEYRFTFSSDNDILLPGLKWHKKLQKSIEECDFGLLLLSTNFLASDYIEKNELPLLLRKCIPVGFKKLDMQRQNLLGLEAHQINFFNGKTFQELTSKAKQEAFIHDLAAKIEERVKRSGASTEAFAGECETKGEKPAREITERMMQFKREGYRDREYITSRAYPGQIAHRPEQSASGDTVTALPFIKNWALESSIPFFALLGNSGTGKTFTCRMLAREINALHDEKPEEVPLCIYIDLRLVSTRIGSEKKIPRLTNILQDALDYTRDPLDRTIVTPLDMIQLVRQNRALIIYDGFDEKSVHFTPEETNRFIAELWSIRENRTENAAKAQGKILISCRTHYFRDLFEQNSLFLGRDRDGRSKEEYRSCTLLPFDDQQIREYLNKKLGSSEEAIERIVALFEHVHNLKELASRPYTLSLITEFIPDIEKLMEEGKPVNTATLYQLTINNWLARDEGKHEFSVEHKKKLMKELAAEIHQRGGAGMSTTELEEWLDNWLYQHPAINSAYATLNRETLKKDLRTATFVIREDENAFSFAHTSLQEYFLAGFITDALSSKDENGKSLAIALPSSETLDFATEMLALDSRLHEKVIRSLNNILERPYLKGASEFALALWQKLLSRSMRTPSPRAIHLETADLSGWKIEKMNLAGARLDQANLRGTSFRKSVLKSASFSQANLVKAEFLDCNAAEANFSEAEAAAVWRNCNLQKSDWNMANLRLASFVSCDVRESHYFLENSEYKVSRCIGIENSPLPETAHPAIYTGHSSLVNSCTFSTDGLSILSASCDNSLKLWDAVTGICILTFSGHTDWVNGCAFSPDGTLIFSASSDKSLKLWDVASGQCILTFTGHTDWVNGCTFSPDGLRLLSASWDKTLKLWDTVSGNCILTLSGHFDSVRNCAFNPDGGYILSASKDDSLKLWDAISGHCILTFYGHANSVNDCTFSPDGTRILSASSDKSLKLWDAASGQCILTLSGHADSVNGCAFSPDGTRILSASSDKSLKLWDAASGQCILTLSGHANSVNDCAFSPNGLQLLSASFDQSLKLWNTITSFSILTIWGHFVSVNGCAFSPDGTRILSASYDKSLKLWDAASGQCILTLSGHADSVNGCAFSPDGTRILSASSDKSLKLWDAASGQCILTLSGHADSVNGCAFSPDGTRILSASSDKSLKLWDAASSHCILTLSGHADSVNGCAFSPDGTRILSASSDKSLKLWDAASSHCILTLSGHADSVNGCAFSPDGTRMLSASYDKSLKLWDAASGQCILTLSGHADWVTANVFSPNGLHILSASWDNTLKLWDTVSGTCILTLSGHTDSVNDCAFSPDGEYILSGSSDKTIKLWDANSGHCLMTMANLPDNETASWSETELKLLSASSEAWRWIGIADGSRRLPIELIDDAT